MQQIQLEVVGGMTIGTLRDKIGLIPLVIQENKPET